MKEKEKEKGKGGRERKREGRKERRKGKARQGKCREEFALARSIVVAADGASSRFVMSGQIWQRLSPILHFRLRSLILIFCCRCSSPACPQSSLAYPCFGNRFPFLLPNVDPSHNLPLQNVVYTLPRNDVNHDNECHQLMSIRHFIKQL